MSEVTINATTEAATINSVASDIGSWAKSKGFREDWDDAEWLRKLAEAGDVGADSETEIAFTPDMVARLRAIADNHVRLANVCKLMLMVSEAAEALSAMRDGNAHYGEELADLAIRVFENSEANNIAIGDQIINKMNVNVDRPYKHGRQF